MSENTMDILCEVLKDITQEDIRGVDNTEDFITKNLTEISENEKSIEKNLNDINRLMVLICLQKSRDTTKYKSLDMLEAFLKLPEIPMYSSKDNEGRVSSLSKILTVLVGEVEVELDLEPGSWYKEDVENNISHSNSNSISSKEGIIMTDKKTTTEESATEEATFGQKVKAATDKVSGPAFYILLGMAIFKGTLLVSKAVKSHRAKQAEQAAS